MGTNVLSDWTKADVNRTRDMRGIQVHDDIAASKNTNIPLSEMGLLYDITVKNIEVAKCLCHNQAM